VKITVTRIALVATLAGILYVPLSGAVQLNQSWRNADQSSAGFAPSPAVSQEAVVQVYVARVVRWRGIFAVHPWVSIKPKGADAYTVYQVLGWRARRNQLVVVANEDVPDRHWFGNKPDLLVDLRGAAAEAVIDPVLKAIESYPFADSYSQWPGPNSNTFIAHIGRQVPGLRLNLPATAIGKDYLGKTSFVAKAPSGTGYQLSLFGLFGVLLAWEEGLEINVLTFNLGFNPFKLHAKFPFIGSAGITLPEEK
jgi:hypothetical protein